MIMNHRCSVRMPFCIAVDIFKRGEYLGRFTTRDICIDGAFIETRGQELFPNDIAEVVFVSETANRVYDALEMIVVRRSDQGVGILFAGNSTAYYQQMAELFPNQVRIDAIGSAGAGEAVKQGVG